MRRVRFITFRRKEEEEFGIFLLRVSLFFNKLKARFGKKNVSILQRRRGDQYVTFILKRRNNK